MATIIIMFIGNKTVRKFIVITMTVLASEPADHQTFPRSALLFADARTGIPVTEHSLTDRAYMGVLTALNKKHRYPL